MCYDKFQYLNRVKQAMQGKSKVGSALQRAGGRCKPAGRRPESPPKPAPETAMRPVKENGRFRYKPVKRVPEVLLFPAGIKMGGNAGTTSRPSMGREDFLYAEEDEHMEEKQYLMLPGPTPVPPRLLRAMAKPMINHRGPEFKALYEEVIEGLKEVFRTKNDVFIYTAAGTGAMEAAVANFVSPGDKVLVVSIGVFGNRFASIAGRFGAQVEKLDFTWGTAADPDALAERIRADEKKEIKAVFVTHNETSTGVTNDLKALRAALGDHPALFIVDSVSGLGAMELETDLWNLDVVVAGSQKSFMIPPGLSFIAVGPRAWEARAKCRNACFYWDVEAARKSAEKGQTPFTPAIPQIAALAEALKMMRAEGLENIFARHRRLREMTRRGIKAMGLKPLAADDVASAAVTAVLAPEGLEANAIRRVLLKEFNVVVAGGQQSLDNKIFRIGHLGHVGDLEIIAVLAALEMALNRCGFKVELGKGVKAAQEVSLAALSGERGV